MQITRPAVAHADARGEITDILEKTPVNAVTLLTLKRGAVRGNHYHRHTTQWLYVLSGRIYVAARSETGRVVSALLCEGELVMNPPLEAHAIRADADAVLLALAAGPRDGRDYENDTYRLDTPLIEAVDDPGQ